MSVDTKILAANDENIAAAAQVLRDGGLVAFPTETVYGLGANALDMRAVRSIFTAKGRPHDNPLIVHLADVNSILPLVKHFPESARQIAQKFWPGPLTLILPRGDAIAPSLCAGLDSVAVRIPSHPVAQRLLELAGVPVAAPSANRSGRPSATSANHCVEDLWGFADIILDGGECSLGVESTVISLIGETPRLLRPGGVTPCEIEDVIGRIEIDDAIYRELEEDEIAPSPGMKHKHYAPIAKATLVSGSLESFVRFCGEHNSSNMWVLVFDEDKHELENWGFSSLSYGSENDPATQANRLFAALRELDDKGAEVVYIRAPKKCDGLGLAVYNRLLRAAAFMCYDLGDNNLGEEKC